MARTRKTVYDWKRGASAPRRPRNALRKTRQRFPLCDLLQVDADYMKVYVRFMAPTGLRYREKICHVPLPLTLRTMGDFAVFMDCLGFTFTAYDRAAGPSSVIDPSVPFLEQLQSLDYEHRLYVVERAEDEDL